MSNNNYPLDEKALEEQYADLLLKIALKEYLKEQALQMKQQEAEAAPDRNGRGRQYLGQKQPGRLLHPADLLADQGALEAGFRQGQLGIGEIAVAQLFPGPFL